MSNETSELYQVTASYFCAGLVFRGSTCIKAAPISGWARGMEMMDIDSYCKRKGWKLEKVS